MAIRLCLCDVMARLLRVAVVLAFVMLGVTMPQGAARAGTHEMHAMSGAMVEMPVNPIMKDHAAGMKSGMVHGGHSLACAIACVGAALPVEGPLAPLTFQVMAMVWVTQGWAIPNGRAPAPTARPPKSI